MKRTTSMTPSKHMLASGVAPRSAFAHPIIAAKPFSNPNRRMERKDWGILICVTVLYACLAFCHLGATAAPQNAYTFQSTDETVVFDLGEQYKEFYILFYGGIHWSDSNFSIQVSNNGTNWSEPSTCEMMQGSEFQWKYAFNEAGFENRAFSGRYIQVTADHIGLTVFEILFRDSGQNVLPIKSVVDSLGADVSSLVDEQDTLSGEPGWFNSMYFDEIYHARTAYEHLHGLRTFEISHPPLGKVLMSWGIAIFGMTPFGWRFSGTLCGVLMLPCMYLLGRLLFQKRRYAVLPMLLLALDCMHYTQTRIATIDSFVVLFILWAVYCMLRWFLDESAQFREALLNLGLSGLFFGLACASKWTGLYAGTGLALVFFLGIWRRARKIHRAKAALRLETDRQGGKTLIERDKAMYCAAIMDANQIWISLACCLIFFLLIPAVIYYCSYIPYFAYAGGVTVSRVIHAAAGMYQYHSTPGLGMEHQFYSPWYEWPLSIRPMFYTRDHYEPPGYASTILAFGNPAVWWIGLLALAIVVCIFIKQRANGMQIASTMHATRPGIFPSQKAQADTRVLLLLICFAAQFLPWILVPRGTYIYHYFPSVPFVVLCTALVFEYGENFYLKKHMRKIMLKAHDRKTIDLCSKKADKRVMFCIVIYIVLVVILFVLLFPHASGWQVSTKWLQAVNWFGNLYY